MASEPHDSMSYKDLQELAKTHGVKHTQKKAKLLEDIRAKVASGPTGAAGAPASPVASMPPAAATTPLLPPPPIPPRKRRASADLMSPIAKRANTAFISHEDEPAVAVVEEPSHPYTVTPFYRELGPDGTLAPRKRLMRNFTVNTDAALARQMGAMHDDDPVADEVLALLHTHFVPLPSTEGSQAGGSWENPSHQWSSEVPREVLHDTFSRLCESATRVLRAEPTMLEIPAPAYLLGDLHGNYRDLRFFASNFWRLGIDVCPGKVLCLGDYVDRGPHAVETVAYLLALKLKAPDKVFLLRGNHECSDVNGDVDEYGHGSFRYQCEHFFGEVEGHKLWETFNNAFDVLPICAIVDSQVFCTHGGIPRAMYEHEPQQLLQTIRNIKRPLKAASLSTGKVNKKVRETGATEVCLINDLLWADPASPEQEKTMKASAGKTNYPPGFGPNEVRGPEFCVFGIDAVNAFLRATGCSHIVRAHIPPQMGIDYAKAGQVLTVFSSSHYCGQHNSAAIVLACDLQLRVIIAKTAEDAPKAGAKRARASLG